MMSSGGSYVGHCIRIRMETDMGAKLKYIWHYTGKRRAVDALFAAAASMPPGSL